MLGKIDAARRGASFCDLVFCDGVTSKSRGLMTAGAGVRRSDLAGRAGAIRETDAVFEARDAIQQFFL